MRRSTADQHADIVQTKFAGLPNLGSTCFLNATLASVLASTACRSVVEAAAEFADGGLAETLALIATAATNGVVPAPSRLRAVLRELDDKFAEGQHDAAECLLEFLSVCEADPLLRPLYELFVREEHANFFCGSCDEEYEQFRRVEETVMALPMPNSADPESLDACVAGYSAPEHVPELKCAKCGVKGGVLKSLHVERAPNVLALHLKRTSASKTARAEGADACRGAAGARLWRPVVQPDQRHLPSRRPRDGRALHHPGSVDCCCPVARRS